MGGVDDIEDANAVIASVLVEAAKASGVPKLQKRKKGGDMKIDNLLRRKRKTEEGIRRGMRHSHERNAKKRVIEINQMVAGIIESRQEREEERVVSDIKLDSAAFFTYANRNKKLKGNIGPL